MFNPIQEYVVGFLFFNDKKNVILIRKKKPNWQAGKLNGIGGKIENGESPHQAMIREFLEETEVDIPTWNLFCKLTVKKPAPAYIYFYKADSVFHILNHFLYKKQTNDVGEEIIVRTTSGLINSNEKGIVPNLKWLIPMAMDKDNIVSTVEES